MTDPFDGCERVVDTTPAVGSRSIAPAFTLAAISRASEAPSKPIGARRIEEDDDSLVIGLFDPKSFGAVLREEEFDAGEIVRTLISTIRTGQDKDKLPAIRMLRDYAKESMKLTGMLNTTEAKVVATKEDGTTHEYTVSQTNLMSKMQSRPTVINPIGVNVTPPLKKEDIDAANIRIPIDRSSAPRPELVAPGIARGNTNEEEDEEDTLD